MMPFYVHAYNLIYNYVFLISCKISCNTHHQFLYKMTFSFLRPAFGMSQKGTSLPLSNFVSENDMTLKVCFLRSCTSENVLMSLSLKNNFHFKTLKKDLIPLGWTAVEKSLPDSLLCSFVGKDFSFTIYPRL